MIHEQKGDYIGGLKDKGSLFYNEVKITFDEEILKRYTNSKKHYI